MRRIALLGLTLLLPACSTLVGSPFDGAGAFVGDTHTLNLNPNRPRGDAVNLRRAMGQPVEVEPLTPEPGDVWPVPARPQPTLQDIQRSNLQQQQEDNTREPPPPPGRRGSSTPPGPAPTLPPAPQAPPPTPPTLPPANSPRTQFYPAPGGPAVGTQLGNGVQTYTDPRGQVGIVVPNANGTSTLIGPDGSVTTVPNPR